MTHPSFSNIGAYVKTMYGSTGKLTAGGSGDATLVTGTIIDRTQLEGAPSTTTATRFPGDSLAGSAIIQLVASATLAASKKLDVLAVLRHGEDSALADAANAAAALQPSGDTTTPWMTLTDSGAGSTLTSVKEFDVNLESLGRYIQVQVTPDLNAANTDTAFFALLVTLGGFKHKPT